MILLGCLYGFDWLWLGIAVLLDVWGVANGSRVGWTNRSAIPGYARTGSNI